MSAAGNVHKPSRQSRKGAGPPQNQGYGGQGAGSHDFSDPNDYLNHITDRFGGGAAQNNPPQAKHDRFGGLKPFEHHHVPEEIKDHF